jgi:hypothetical protein
VTPPSYTDVKALFLAVRDLGAAARSAHLDSACGDDRALRRRVEQLLAAHDAGESFLQPVARAFIPVVEAPARTSPAGGSKPPQEIGKYRVLGVLGEGGMGVVYLAEQDCPRREVALKLIRPGFASQQLLRRLEHEAQLLGRLQHPASRRSSRPARQTREAARSPSSPWS